MRTLSVNSHTSTNTTVLRSNYAGKRGHIFTCSRKLQSIRFSKSDYTFVLYNTALQIEQEKKKLSTPLRTELQVN